MKILKLRFLALGVLVLAICGLCVAQTAAPAASPDTSKAATKTAKKAKAGAVDPSTVQQAPGGGGGKLWCNTSSHVAHKEGDEWYGKTKHGQYMTPDEAQKAGCKPEKESPVGKKKDAATK